MKTKKLSSSKRALRVFIFSILLGAECISYVKSIATYAPTFLGYITSVRYTLIEKLRLKFAKFHNFSKNNKFYHFNKFFHFFRSPIEANRPLNRPLDGPLDKTKPPKPSAKVQKRTHNQNEFHEKNS